MRTCCNRRELDLTKESGAADVSTRSSTFDMDARGWQKTTESLIGLDAGIDASGNSPSIFEVAFFTSNRLLMRFNSRIEDAMISRRDSIASVPRLLSSLASLPSPLPWIIRLVMPMIPWRGVRSSCVRVTMESPMALAIMASSWAFFSARSRARISVMSLKTTSTRRSSFFVLEEEDGDETCFGVLLVAPPQPPWRKGVASSWKTEDPSLISPSRRLVFIAKFPSPLLLLLL